MVKRFRMIADDIFAQVAETGAYSPKFPVSKDELVRYAEESKVAALKRASEAGYRTYLYIHRHGQPEDQCLPCRQPSRPGRA